MQQVGLSLRPLRIPDRAQPIKQIDPIQRWVQAALQVDAGAVHPCEGKLRQLQRPVASTRFLGVYP